MENHPVTELFPLMAGKDYEKLVADIREHGLREPIWLHPDGRIIDGRNRWRACEDAEVEPQTRAWDGEGSLTAFVVSLNLHRRHLTSSQRAAAAAEALPMLKAEARERQGRRTDLRANLPQKIGESQHSGEAAERAAKMFDTNRAYVQDAAKLKEEAPDVFKAVKSGELTLSQEVNIDRYIQRDTEINRRVVSLGLGVKDLVRLANLGKKGDYIGAALDIFKSDETTTVKEAVAQVRQNIKAEKEELKQRQEESRRRSDEETEREWQEREPFEFFAELLVDWAYTCDRLQTLQRHIKNCGLKKLQAEIDKRLAEIEAQDEADARLAAAE